MILGLLYQVPAVNYRLGWRVDAAQAYVRGVIDPADAAPTPKPRQTLAATPLPTTMPTPTMVPFVIPTATTGPTPTPIPSPTPLPSFVLLDSPDWEKQDWNNCGPATLGLYLHTFGWEGDQFDISDLLKPKRGDRNVNVEELIFYVRTRAGWLNAEFRVGGDIDLLRKFLAAGISVMIEEGYFLETMYWPNDDRWAGHYLLLTGYDDATRTFTAQDTFLGPDRVVPYKTLDAGWQAFNRVYILVYLPHQEETVIGILGPHWDPDFNRQHAIEVAQAEIDADAEDAFAWFNLGSNLVYYERWGEAALAYDTARTLGLPQRMLRYQFGPFFAYFHSARIDELQAITDYALRITDNSEEALLWKGWAYYREGDSAAALERFNAALDANPFHEDAQYAIDFVGGN